MWHSTSKPHHVSSRNSFPIIISSLDPQHLHHSENQRNTTQYTNNSSKMLPTREDYLQTGLLPLSPTSQDTTMCPICTDIPISPITLNLCKHIFCKSCITQWLTLPHRNTCPTCRKILFQLSSPLPTAAPSERLVLMSQAMAHAGLLGGNYLRFSDDIHINISELYRAAAQANLWLGEESQMAAAGPAVVENARLGIQVVAMGNLLMGFARASGRQYSAEQTRQWKILMKKIFEVIKRGDGRRMDAMVFPALMREEMKRDLTRRNLVSETFFDSEVQPNSLRADMDLLLQYLAVKTVEAYTAREALRTMLRPGPSTLEKVGRWFRTLGQ